MKSILLATVFAVGTIAAASAQSQMNQTPATPSAIRASLLRRTAWIKPAISRA